MYGANSPNKDGVALLLGLHIVVMGRRVILIWPAQAIRYLHGWLVDGLLSREFHYCSQDKEIEEDIPLQEVIFPGRVRQV